MMKHPARLLKSPALTLCLFVTGVLFCTNSLADPWFIRQYLEHPAAPVETLHVVADDNLPPLLFRNEKGELQGLIKDKWELWSKRTRTKVSVEGVAWSQALQLAMARQVEVVDTLTLLPSRESVYSFSKESLPLNMTLFFSKGLSGIFDAKSSQAFTIGVKAGDACIDHLRTAGATNLKEYRDYDTLISAAAQGDIHVFCMLEVSADYLLDERGLAGEFKRTPPLYVAALHWAVPQGNPILKDFIEDGFSHISDREKRALDSKWLGATVGPSPLRAYLDYVAYALVVFSGVGVFLLVWNQALRYKVAKKTKQLTSTSRALLMVTHCNEAILHAKSEPELFQEICRQVCESGGYLMAWVGLPLPDEEQTVKTAAYWGKDEGFLAETRTSWGKSHPRGANPTSQAIRTGFTQVNEDFSANLLAQAWAAAATARGFHSSVTLPLQLNESVIGALTLYAGTTNAFSAEEVHLLENLAKNISFGVKTLREQEHRRLAESASRAKNRYMASLSHEIRTPLNAINGLAQVLRTHTSDMECQDKLGKIITAGDHLRALIDDVVDVSRIEAGRLKLNEEDFQLEDVTHCVYAMLDGLGRPSAVQLGCRIEPLPYYIRGDKTRLTQALLNLSTNALKFTKEGLVTLTSSVVFESEVDLLLRLEVADTGCGIAPEMVPRLFEEFEQGSFTGTGGSGLGLAVTRLLAEAMGGTAGVQSKLGEGSVFWFTVHMKKGPALQSVPYTGLRIEELASEIRNRFRGQQVLVVDDEPLAQATTADLLLTAGLSVQAVASGRAALDLVKAKPAGTFSLILLDLSLPDLDGFSVSKALRELMNNQLTPIVGLTVNASLEDKSLCFEAGINSLLMKPLKPWALYAKTLSLLEATAIHPADLSE